MKLPYLIEKVADQTSVMDIVIIAILSMYIIFPVSTPLSMVPLIDSPVGYVVLFAIAVGLFTYTSPLLAIVFIFAAYELLRRNNYAAPSSPIPEATQYLANRVPQSTVTQSEKNNELKEMNPPVAKTLEEEAVALSCTNVSTPDVFVPMSYLPVAERSSIGATLYN